MSEAEKKKRFSYRKHREKWIFTQSILVVVLTLAVLISSLVAYQLNKTYYIDYTDSGNIDYKVYLKDNEFYEKPYLEKDQSYVASLVDHIITTFNYKLDMNAEDVYYRYSYSITANLEITDNTSGAAIFNHAQEIKSQTNVSQASNSSLQISEIAVLDYDQYNDLANKFLAAYSLDQTTSNIVVTFKVDVISDCNAFTGGSSDSYVSELRIPLTTKTVNINMTSSVPQGETKMIACTRGVGSEVFKTTAIVLGIVDLLLVLFLVAFIYLTRTEDITYTARIKKILSQYKSYIQKIHNLFDVSCYQTVWVDTFEEMLEIRDTIQAPILMYENEDKTCTKFIIPTDNKLLYLYEIKIPGFVDSTPTPPPPAEQPSVVRDEKKDEKAEGKPEVKVVVVALKSEAKAESSPSVEPAVEPTPKPEAETEPTLETEEEIPPETAPEVETEIAAETEPQAVAEITPEPILEPEITAAVEEVIGETVEETGIDVIDVFWPERNNDNKTYRYDPDGEAVEAGDVVLVPTRDVSSDKDVIREAEVAKGNYKVDPDTLNHPLKKIIGVVRRKAEQVFTAMINTEDDQNQKETKDN
ncbi:MAG: hypothetical protein IJY47_03410 [Clostridia bacterium]|nr:hypothetical protein [Clostridia bacterium]